MILHPRYKRQLRKTLVVGIIWLVFGLLYVFLEYGLIGGLTTYPNTSNKYDFQNSLIFTSTGSFLMGLVQGWIEVSWFKKRLNHLPFWKKILIKSICYISFLILFLCIMTLTTNSQRYNLNFFDPIIIDSLLQFIRSFAFWSVILYSCIILDVSLFYLEISEYLGSGVLYNYSFGTYHKPKMETRIFMFLDMKSSTSIAESIGHERYFDLLKTYYADMTDAILETSGQIYQYVGDEIVVTWPKNKGIEKNNCIQCFSKISEAIEQKKAYYIERYGIVPEFKAGYHIGDVTTGEIGILKKDIIYTGDVLNTAARIQAKCNTYDAKILISGDLLNELQKEDPIEYNQIGELLLRGKTEAVQLYKLTF